MDSNTFMGFFIAAVLALLGGAGVIAKIIVTPIIKLNRDITTLQVTIDGHVEKVKKIEESQQRMEAIQLRHENRLDDQDKKLTEIDKKLFVYNMRTAKEVKKK